MGKVKRKKCMTLKQAIEFYDSFIRDNKGELYWRDFNKLQLNPNTRTVVFGDQYNEDFIQNVVRKYFEEKDKCEKFCGYPLK